MRVLVRYFAVFREHLGIEGETLELGEAATVADAIDAIADKHDTIASLAGRFQVAVNHVMVEPNHVLDNGDELALIPPVAGGTNPKRMAMVSEAPISLESLIAAVVAPTRGAVATFTGVVRNHHDGRAVNHLVYEAYVEMANKMLVSICDRIEAQDNDLRVAVQHRTGKLEIGDIAVAIAAASPHRAQAFAACRQCIDDIKIQVPIWKREVGPDGAIWVGLDK